MNDEQQNKNQWSQDELRLSAALHAAAKSVKPGPDGLAQIRQRTRTSPWWRKPAFYGVTAGVATAAAAILVVVNVMGSSEDNLSVRPMDTPTASDSTPPGTDDPTTGPGDPTDQATDPGTDSTEDTESGTEDADPTGDPTDPGTEGGGTDTGGEPTNGTEPPNDDGNAEQSMSLPVYYTVGDRITREWQRVQTADPLGAAIHQALNEPPLDPRYKSLWEPVRVTSAVVADDVIEVDLRSPVRLAADAGAGAAEEAVQQLVYTATATAASAYDNVNRALPVRILVDGKPPKNLFGELDLSQPVTRDDELDVRYFVQIDSPAYGAQVDSANVTVTGVAAAHEANLLWELRQDGTVVDSGATSTGEAATFAEFSIELGELDAGTYEITVKEDDVSGGEGRDPFFDTKQFEVTGR